MTLDRTLQRVGASRFHSVMEFNDYDTCHQPRLTWGCKHFQLGTLNIQLEYVYLVLTCAETNIVQR
jgi:hypothetical protein